MKKLFGILLISVLLLGNTACSSTPSAGDMASQNKTPGESTQNDQTMSKPIAADLSGEVVSISGNNITIKIIDTTVTPDKNEQMIRPEGQNNPPPQDNADQTPPAPERQRSESPDGNPPQQRELSYTGETKTITITSDTTITKMTRKKDATVSESLSLEDINEEDILQITYSDKDNEIISNISIMSFPARP